MKIRYVLLCVFLLVCAHNQKNGDFAVVDEFTLRAIKTLEPKCKEGNLSACNDLGVSYQNAKFHEKALLVYENACDLGYQTACANLAAAYLKARGVSKDEQKAVRIYADSCAKGGAYSCYFLGEFYRTDGNFTDAANAYASGCDLGDVPSCVNLGGLFELGLGVAKDEKRAFNIYKNACAKFESAGCENLKRLKNKF